MTSFRASIPIRCVSWYCCLLAGCATLPASSQVDHDLKVADIELASGAPDAALRIMQDLAARRPGDARVTLRMGEADAALGHPQAAEASFRRVLATAPGNVPAGLGLARAAACKRSRRRAGRVARAREGWPTRCTDPDRPWRRPRPARPRRRGAGCLSRSARRRSRPAVRAGGSQASRSRSRAIPPRR